MSLKPVAGFFLDSWLSHNFLYSRDLPTLIRPKNLYNVIHKFIQINMKSCGG